MLEKNDSPDGSKNSLYYLPPPVGHSSNRSTKEPELVKVGFLPPEVLCLLPSLLSALEGPSYVRADDLPWGSGRAVSWTLMVCIPHALQRAQGVLAMLSPFLKLSVQREQLFWDLTLLE